MGIFQHTSFYSGLAVFRAWCPVLLLIYGLASAEELPVAADHGMVVSASEHASAAGIEIMQAGGNAFDAAATVGFVLAVTFPEAGNLGGGGFMVARTADGQNLSLDFRETAPAAAHRDMFLDERGNVIDGLSLRSALSSGVPGTVDGLLKMWNDHGSGNISREALLAPAIRLADDGFSISASLADALNSSAVKFKADPEASRIFIRKDGRPWTAGHTLEQYSLAHVLRFISYSGRDAFYTQGCALQIAQKQARTGGLITIEDLANYASVYREAIVGTFRNYEIVTMGPPSSGGVLLIQMLNMLEELPFRQTHWNSPLSVHLLTEVQRRAYADRAVHLGDPDFWDVPVQRLTSHRYARERAGRIKPHRITLSADLSAGEIAPQESEETTHFSVVDKDRNAVAVTVTLNGRFGSGKVIHGFLMNNEMDDFSSKPGVPNLYGVTGGEANAIEPGKRMLSSMTPTIALKDGKTALVLGSPGGATIITTVLQVFLNVAVHEMDIQDAVAAPRHHSQWLPDRIEYEDGAISEKTRRELSRMGHTFAEAPRSLGAANCILIDEDKIYGAPDARRQSAAVGY